MKRLLLILILTISFQSLTIADDIRDFEIEGISIGDSLLDYVSKEFILKENQNVYDGQDNYKVLFLEKPNFDLKKYDGLQLHFQINDKNYFIKGIDAFIYYENDIKNCYLEKNEISESVFTAVKADRIKKDKAIHPGDNTGKSTYDRSSIFLKKNSVSAEIEIICYDNSREFIYIDKLSISLYSDDYGDFLDNYYK